MIYSAPIDSATSLENFLNFLTPKNADVEAGTLPLKPRLKCHVIDGSLTWDNIDPFSYEANFFGVLKNIRGRLLKANLVDIPADKKNSLLELAKKVNDELIHRIARYESRNWYSCRFWRRESTNLSILKDQLNSAFTELNHKISLKVEPAPPPPPPPPAPKIGALSKYRPAPTPLTSQEVAPSAPPAPLPPAARANQFAIGTQDLNKVVLRKRSATLPAAPVSQVGEEDKENLSTVEKARKKFGK